MIKKLFSLAFLILYSLCSFAVDKRFELNVGATFGDPEISFFGVRDKVDFDNGLIFGASLWFDEVFSEIISLGISFHHTKNFEFSGGELFETPNTNLSFDADITTFMANILIRDNQGDLFNNSKFHPYVGFGYGIASIDSQVTNPDTFTANTVLFILAGNQHDSNYAAQLNLGIDYDINENVYLGIDASYFYTDVTIFGAEVKLNNLRTMLSFGYRF